MNRNNIRIITSSRKNLVNIHKYQYDLKYSFYNKFDKYYDAIIISYSQLKMILAQNLLKSSDFFDVNINVTLSSIQNIVSRKGEIVFKLSINNIQNLFQNTYGIYYGENDYFNFSYKIGFINYLYKNLLSNQECINISKIHKCDKNGTEICRDPTKINFPLCNKSNNLSHL
ncbi:hypothetical protein HZS_7661 [Henneguya salminicola]|nr:hypothetical protein HZS_7661 [Henneguya salminicola]